MLDSTIFTVILPCFLSDSVLQVQRKALVGQMASILGGRVDGEAHREVLSIVLCIKCGVCLVFLHGLLSNH